MAVKGKPRGGEADAGEEDASFLSRWARRKQETREQELPATPEPAQQPAPDSVAAGEAAEPVKLEDLPDIDSLDDSSDFSVFLREGVPDVLRRKALRKLWRVNPVLANLDGLNDYDEDFTDAAKVVEGLKTLYQVGKGVVLPEEEAVADRKSVEDGGGSNTDDVVDKPIADLEAQQDSGLDGEKEPDAAIEFSEEPQAVPESLDRPVELDRVHSQSAVQPRRPAAERRWRRFES